jgi:hypothetical protein
MYMLYSDLLFIQMANKHKIIQQTSLEDQNPGTYLLTGDPNDVRNFFNHITIDI